MFYPKLLPIVDLSDTFKHRLDNNLKEHNVLKHLGNMRAKIHERTLILTKKLLSMNSMYFL